MRFLLKHNGHTKAIIFDKEVAETIRWVFPDYTLTKDAPKKVATLQPPQPIKLSHPHDGIEAMRVFDCSDATQTTRRLSIHVSYTVKHNVRHYLARHTSFGTIRGETFDHDSAAHWFFQKIKTIWPAYTINKT